MVGPSRTRWAVTLTSPEPLACRVALIAWCRPALAIDDLAVEIARAIGVAVTPAATRELVASFVEPLELMVAARQLVEPLSPQPAQVSRCGVRGLAVSALAAELLADAAEPTRSVWQWVLYQLGAGTPVGPFVAAVRAGCFAADALVPPRIALRFPPGRGVDPPDAIQLFDQERVTIGRNAQWTDIAIRDGNISRRHCAFIRRDDAWYFKDLGSTGGCHFEGMRVDNLRVVTGDVFHLADYEIEVVAVV